MLNATPAFGRTEDYRKRRGYNCADLGSIHANADT
jgi:hypothetical protein